MPDAPVSRFDLRIRGGKQGILVATRGVCGRSRVAKPALDAHNGKRQRTDRRLAADCRKRR